MKRTKIVATIGPASDAPEMIDELIKAGVNIFRFNMKHADNEWHDERIQRVRDAMHRVHMPIGILIDLQGPEVRLETPDKAELSVSKGEIVPFSLEPITDGSKHVVIRTKEVFESVKAGDRLLIDDGSMEFDIVEVGPSVLKAVALQDCTIKHRKSVNFPMVDISLPSLEKGDYERLSLKNIKEVDFVALSFTRTKRDVEILREEMDKRELKAKICAKIENQTAINNLDEIIETADAIMIARGDLAVEIPYERIIYWQKHMIERCRALGKPVITATQMLHSMVNNARPTRAEISDVTNAVYDGTDCLMLSEESAGGKHPLTVVRAMERIASYAESVAVPPSIVNAVNTHPADLARGTVQMIQTKEERKVSAAIVFCKDNLDYVRFLSSYRLAIPIIALSEDSVLRRTIRASYGVLAPKLKLANMSRENLREILEKLKEIGYIHEGEFIYVIDEMKDERTGEDSSYFLYTKVS